MKFSGRFLLLTAVLAAIVSPAAHATFHLIEINEVYSNADGSVQYVELRAVFPGQTELQHTRIVAHNSDGTVGTVVLDFTARFAALGNNETVLIATPAFESVAGFAPDFVMTSGSLISFPDGRVIFTQDPPFVDLVVDSVAYGAYTGSNTGFGLPAAALPFDGVHSLTRISSSVTPNNAIDFAIRTNSPRRNDGCTTTLSAAAFRDCNANGHSDACEVATGSLNDENENDVPDVCEDRGDFDGDGDVDLGDYRRLHDCLDGPNGGILPGCDVQDLTGDEAVDLADAAQFQNAFGTPPP